MPTGICKGCGGMRDGMRIVIAITVIALFLMPVLIDPALDRRQEECETDAECYAAHGHEM